MASNLTNTWQGAGLSQTWNSPTVTTYNTPSSGVTDAMQQLVNSYNTTYEQAKAHNDALYNQMLGISNDYLSGVKSANFDTSGLYQNALQEVGNLSGQRAADIRSDSEKVAANQRQSAARLGLSNTTIVPTLNQGTEREKQSSLNRLADEMATLKAGIYQNQAGSQLAGAQAQSQAYGGAYNTMLNTMGNYGSNALPDLSSIQTMIQNVMANYGGGQGLQAGLNSLNKLRLA